MNLLDFCCVPVWLNSTKLGGKLSAVVMVLGLKRISLFSPTTMADWLWPYHISQPGLSRPAVRTWFTPVPGARDNCACQPNSIKVSVASHTGWWGGALLCQSSSMKNFWCLAHLTKWIWPHCCIPAFFSFFAICQSVSWIAMLNLAALCATFFCYPQKNLSWGCCW